MKSSKLTTTMIQTLRLIVAELPRNYVLSRGFKSAEALRRRGLVDVEIHRNGISRIYFATEEGLKLRPMLAFLGKDSQATSPKIGDHSKRLRELLREALELANLDHAHDNGHPGGTYHHIREALNNVAPGEAEAWSENGEWPSS